jgi:hypothetical protein
MTDAIGIGDLRGGHPIRAGSFEKALRDTIGNQPYTMVRINVMTL